MNTAAPTHAEEHDITTDILELPGWLYRSEAFAEDLPPAESPVRVGLRAAVPSAIYTATLACALLALPAVCLVA